MAVNSLATSNTIGVDWSPTLLVIDDDPNIHDLMEHYLAGIVSKTIHARSGTQGILMAKTSRPDVILLDIEMPDMDGFQVCRKLKEDDTNDIPILFLTKDKESYHIAKALDYGGLDYVTKPFVPVELQARVRSALRVKRAGDVLKQQALVDPLTNLSNRRAFDDALSASIAEYTRNRHDFSVLILDLDHFKTINDTYGYGVGDEVLTQVGMAIRRECRPYDIAARYGGEEFAVILKKTEPAEARIMAKRLLEAIRQLSISAGEHQLQVTASAGLACMPDQGTGINVNQFVEQANAALYESKRQGRDQMVEWGTAKSLSEDQCRVWH